MESDRGSPTHSRRPLRLRAYDYSQPGAYFVTLCTHNRQCMFGNISDNEMLLNSQGRIVEEEWLRTAHIRRQVTLDTFVVMPNHIHGIVVINESTFSANVGATRRVAPTHGGHGPAPGTLGAIVGQFKSTATKRINASRGSPKSLVWQRNYYEHVVRNEESLNRIREYIVNNPQHWDADENNPANL